MNRRKNAIKSRECHGFPDVLTSNSLVLPAKLTLAHNYFVTFFRVVYSLHSFVNLARNRPGYDDVLRYPQRNIMALFHLCI